VAGHPAAQPIESAPRPANIQQTLVVRRAESVLLTVVAPAPLALAASRPLIRRVLVEAASVSPAAPIPALSVPAAAARPPTARVVATVRRAVELAPVPSVPDVLALNSTEASAPHGAGLVPSAPSAQPVAAVISPAATVRRAVELAPVPSDPDALAPNSTEASAPHGVGLMPTALAAAPDSARPEASAPSAPTAAEPIL